MNRLALFSKYAIKVFVTVQGACLNLGEKLDLSAGWAKKFLKKRSIDGYMSIFQRFFRPRCAKYGFSFIQRERLSIVSTNQCRANIKSSKRSRGLTLIEVLVALAILAIGLTALLQHTASSIHISRRVDETLIKHWVAMQAISSIQSGLIPTTLGQNSIHTMSMLGQTWYWQAQVQATFIKTMEQMTITVSDKKTGPFTDPLIGFRHV